MCVAASRRCSLLLALLGLTAFGVKADDEAALCAELLKSQEPARALALVQRGAAAVPFLNRGLELGGRVPALCAWALAQHPQPGTDAALRRLLWQVDQVAGYWATRALGRLPGAENVKALAALLPDERLGFWELSAGGVGRITDVHGRGGRRWAEAEDWMPNLRVAYAAMESLGELGGEAATLTLLRGLENDQYLIRYGAARGLGRMAQGGGGVPLAHQATVRKRLTEMAENDPVLIVRLGCRQAVNVDGKSGNSPSILGTSPIWLPLTSALSLGEREALRQSAEQSRRPGSAAGRQADPTPAETREGPPGPELRQPVVGSRRDASPALPAIAFIKTRHRSDANLGFRDSYFFPKTPKYHAGENVFTLQPPRPDGVLKNLTQLTNGEVQGLEVSFDGTKLLFAMRRDKTRDGFHLFEINTDGTGLRQLTDGNCNDVDPCYLADGRIAFCSDRAGWQEYYHQERSRVLYVMDPDGSNIEPITFNPNQDYEPLALRDGRVLYGSYRFYAQDGSEGPLRGEWMGLARIETVLRAANPDGSGDNLFYGSMRGSFYSPLRPMPFSDQWAGWHRRGYHVGVSISQPRELPDGRIVCVTPAGLTLVDPARAPVDCEMPIFPEVVNLAGGEEVYIHNYDDMNPVGRHTTPYPVGGDWILVSHAPWHDLRVNGYALYLMNLATRELRPVYDDPQTADVDPVPLAPQPRPAVRESTLATKGSRRPLVPAVPSDRGRARERAADSGEGATPSRGTAGSPRVHERSHVEGAPATGLIYCNSIFNTDLPFDRKSVTHVRVLEGVLMGQSIAANAAFRTRLLGTVPIHPDGSFYVEVPADTPVRFELLDADGQMLVHETEFNFVRPGETKGCVGCHEPRKQTAVNARPLALNEPPIRTLRQRGDLIYMGKPNRPYNAIYRE